MTHRIGDQYGFPCGLTDKEVEAIRWLSMGRGQQFCWESIGISRRSFDSRLRSAYCKLKVQRAEAAILLCARMRLLDGVEVPEVWKPATSGLASAGRPHLTVIMPTHSISMAR